MKKNYFYIYTAAALSLILPFPPRFAYGIIGVLLLNFLLYFGFLIKFIAEKLKLTAVLSPVLIVSLVFLTIIFKQLLILYSPLCALTLGFALFMVCFSSYLFGNILDAAGLPPREHIVHTVVRTGLFSLALLLFFLFRDILAYGTITLPVSAGLKQIVLFTRSVHARRSLTVFATIPGTLFLLGFVFAFFSYANRKFMILRRSTAE